MKATDEYISKNDLSILPNRIDYTGRIFPPVYISASAYRGERVNHRRLAANKVGKTSFRLAELTLLGIDYVDLAFPLARATDVKTPFSLNEYGFEYTIVGSQQRRRDILALLHALSDRNTPIDCFGLQSHLLAT